MKRKGFLVDVVRTSGRAATCSLLAWLAVLSSVAVLAAATPRTVVDVELAWAIQAGGSGNDQASDVAIAPDGSVNVTGYFQGTAVFGATTTLVSAGGWDVFLAKYTASGTLQWATTAGGGGDDVGRALDIRPDGGIWVAGSFSGTATFGAGEPGQTNRTSVGAMDIFVARYNSNGTLETVRQTGSSNDDYPNAIRAATDGGALFVGWFKAALGVNRDGPDVANLPFSGPGDSMLARIQPDGTLTWVRRIYGTGNEVIYDAAWGPDGSAVVTGSFTNNAYFGVETQSPLSLASAGEYDGFLAKYAANGAFLWANRLGGSAYDECRSVSVNSLGDVEVGVAMRYNAVVAGQAAKPGGNPDLFVVRYTSSGSLVSAGRTLGSGGVGNGGAAQFSDFQLVACGMFSSGDAVFSDTTLTPNGSDDAYIAFLQTDTWGPVYAAGGAGVDRYLRVRAVPDALVAVGYFNQTAYIYAGQSQSTSVSSSGGDDIWVVKYAPVVADFAAGLSARIEPATPAITDDLTCVAELTDVSGSPDLSWRYRWYKDDVELTTPLTVESEVLPVSGPALSHYYLRLGHRYFCRVEVTDGTYTLRARTQTIDFPLPTPPPGDIYSQGDLEWEAVMDVDQPWEYGAIGAPFVLYDEGKFKMWYATANQNPGAVGTLYGGIGYAESDDGRTWTHKQNLLRATNDGGTSVGMTCPLVMKKAGTYYLYATNYYKLYQGQYWQYLTVRSSTDGLSWSQPTSITTPSDHQSWEYLYYSPLGIFADPLTDGYRLVYQVTFAPLPQWPRNNFASMLSSDGLSWGGRSRMTGSTGAVILGDRYMIPYYGGGFYRMLYAGLDGQLHRASSYDTTRWSGLVDGFADANPLLSILYQPPAGHDRFQYVRMPDGSEYLYFGLFAPTPDRQVYQIARAMLRPPLIVQATARIEPSVPRTLDDLVCTVEIEDPTQAAALTSSYRWFRNDKELKEPVDVHGIPFEVTGSILPNEITTRGETYFCFVRVTDGTSYVHLRSNTVTIVNSTPTAPVVKVVPADPQPWDGLGAEFEEYSIDPDGDPISYEIRWYRSTDGGETFVYRVEVSGIVPQGSWVPPAFLHDGDIWRVEAIPFELPSGKAGSPGAATVRVDGDAGWDQVYVGTNVRPVVVIDTPGQGNAWAAPSVRLSWHSSDADGDPLRVDLYYDADAYAGSEMLIQSGLPGTGSLDWTPPRGRVGLPEYDVNGDDVLSARDLLEMAVHWGIPTRGGNSYRLFARVWDSRNAIGSDYSDGFVIVTETIPADPAGLLQLIDHWRER